MHIHTSTRTSAVEATNIKCHKLAILFNGPDLNVATSSSIESLQYVINICIYYIQFFALHHRPLIRSRRVYCIRMASMSPGHLTHRKVRMHAHYATEHSRKGYSRSLYRTLAKLMTAAGKKAVANHFCRTSGCNRSASRILLHMMLYEIHVNTYGCVP